MLTSFKSQSSLAKTSDYLIRPSITASYATYRLTSYAPLCSCDSVVLITFRVL